VTVGWIYIVLLKYNEAMSLNKKNIRIYTISLC
jgi:hypothetical protein